MKEGVGQIERFWGIGLSGKTLLVEVENILHFRIIQYKGQSPLGLHQFPRSFPLASPYQVGNKSATYPSMGKLRENVSNGFWA